jgi:hypothetical protein
MSAIESPTKHLKDMMTMMMILSYRMNKNPGMESVSARASPNVGSAAELQEAMMAMRRRLFNKEIVSACIMEEKAAMTGIK